MFGARRWRAVAARQFNDKVRSASERTARGNTRAWVENLNNQLIS